MDAVAAFVKDHAEASNAEGASRDQSRARLEAERATHKRAFAGFCAGIGEGVRFPGGQEWLLTLEGGSVAMGAALVGPAATPARLNPNLSALYRGRVTERVIALSVPPSRSLRGRSAVGLLIGYLSVGRRVRRSWRWTAHLGPCSVWRRTPKAPRQRGAQGSGRVR
jgi:hypothetical protein